MRIGQLNFPTYGVPLVGKTAEQLIARIAQKAVQLAREKGIKAGLLRPITLFPYPKQKLFELADQVKGILSVELNAGQMVEDVQLAVQFKVPVEHFGRTGGIIHTPEEVLEALEQKIIK